METTGTVMTTAVGSVLNKAPQYTKLDTLARLNVLIKEGKTYLQTAEILAAEGYRTPRGKLPTLPYVAGLLHTKKADKVAVVRKVVAKKAAVKGTAKKKVVTKVKTDVLALLAAPAVQSVVVEKQFGFGFLRDILSSTEFSAERKIQILQVIYV